MGDREIYAIRSFVRDWTRALDFYPRTLGMPVAFANEAMGWAELATGDSRLALERARLDAPESREPVGRFADVSLRVGDAGALYTDMCRSGVEFVAPPEKQSWGGTLAHLRDPKGNAPTLLGRP